MNLSGSCISCLLQKLKLMFIMNAWLMEQNSVLSDKTFKTFLCSFCIILLIFYFRIPIVNCTFSSFMLYAFETLAVLYFVCVFKPCKKLTCKFWHVFYYGMHKFWGEWRKSVTRYLLLYFIALLHSMNENVISLPDSTLKQVSDTCKCQA